MENHEWPCKGCSARFEYPAAIQYRVHLDLGLYRSIRSYDVECFDPKEGGIQTIPTANLRLWNLVQRPRELLPTTLRYCQACFNRLVAIVREEKDRKVGSGGVLE